MTPRHIDAQVLCSSAPTMHSISGSQLLCSAAQGVFAAAQAMAPAVIFIDEADALASARASSGGSHAPSGGAASEASGRTVAALLASMDSLAGVKCASFDVHTAPFLLRWHSVLLRCMLGLFTTVRPSVTCIAQHPGILAIVAILADLCERWSSAICILPAVELL